ncbi:unnamed protein product [Amoebophrya sp. A25]|nr:unnamed protein product [Amoebophrya sp. A25]|eukprot:GSA25T00022901001.1
MEHQNEQSVLNSLNKYWSVSTLLVVTAFSTTRVLTSTSTGRDEVAFCCPPAPLDYLFPCSG